MPPRFSRKSLLLVSVLSLSVALLSAGQQQPQRLFVFTHVNQIKAEAAAWTGKPSGR